MNVLPHIQQLMNDQTIIFEEQVQSLWSGYGQIIRCKSTRSKQSYVIKVVAPANATAHPRGWDSSIGHQRKLRSYQVESHFYQHHAQLTDEHCKVPSLIACTTNNEFTLLVMEDLDDSGYFVRKEQGDWHSLSLAIRWLAYFHAKFIGESPNGLWPVGSYWHFDTRQDELANMAISEFKIYAGSIDEKLKQASYQTLIHGDAKFANLCFHHNGDQVAAVDFQYIGKGAGVIDLAYLAGSCLTNDELFQYDKKILNEYLRQLNLALNFYNKPIDFEAVTKEVKELYPVAWSDFYRFLLGWNPKSWKVCPFMQEKAQLGLDIVLG